MKKVNITIPQELLTDVVDTLVHALEQEKSKLKSIQDQLSDEQFRKASLECQVKSLRQENKRLYAMLDHEDENWTPNTPTIKQAVEAQKGESE